MSHPTHGKPDPELSPYFEPEVLHCVAELRQQFEQQQLEQELNVLNEPAGEDYDPVAEVLERLCTMLQDVRDEQRDIRVVLERTLKILAGEV